VVGRGRSKPREDEPESRESPRKRRVADGESAVGGLSDIKKFELLVLGAFLAERDRGTGVEEDRCPRYWVWLRLRLNSLPLVLAFSC